MGESKHTPRPWEFRKTTDGETRRTIRGNSDTCTVIAESGWRHPEIYPEAVQKDADFALMAAAPEMLEALRLAEDGGLAECAACTDGAPCKDADGERCAPCEARVAIRAAIAKAEGREP